MFIFKQECDVGDAQLTDREIIEAERDNFTNQSHDCIDPKEEEENVPLQELRENCKNPLKDEEKENEINKRFFCF